MYKVRVYSHILSPFLSAAHFNVNMVMCKQYQRNTFNPKVAFDGTLNRL